MKHSAELARLVIMNEDRAKVASMNDQAALIERQQLRGARLVVVGRREAHLLKGLYHWSPNNRGRRRTGTTSFVGLPGREGIERDTIHLSELATAIQQEQIIRQQHMLLLLSFLLSPLSIEKKQHYLQQRRLHIQ